MIYLSVVIPAYNEEKNIRSGILSEVYEYLKKQDYSWEVIIADDGSDDKTAELAEEFAKKHKGFRILKEPHRGKGGIVIAGVLASLGEIILFLKNELFRKPNQTRAPLFLVDIMGNEPYRSGKYKKPINPNKWKPKIHQNRPNCAVNIQNQLLVFL